MEMLFGEKFNQTSMRKIESIINPPKIDKNQLIMKRAITLFYQVYPIEDFDPVGQFDLIEKIPINQQKFCELLTQVLFKKTKSLFTLKSNFESFTKSIKKDIQKCQQMKDPLNQQKFEELVKVQKSEYIVQNGEKIFCEILTKIRFASSRLQQLIYRLIDIHGWKCQCKNNCQGTYLEGHIAKVLFKKIILPSQVFERQFDHLKALMQQKQLGCENKTDVESLKYEIQKWGKEILDLIGVQNQNQAGLDQKSSPQIKYFLCKACYFGKKQQELEKSSQQITKKKTKKKKKKKNIQGSFTHSSQGNSRKDSLLSFEDKSTNDEIDEQLKSFEDKNFEKLYNFLQDLKIDYDNRIQMRLSIEQENEFNEQSPRKNTLRQRVNALLYKSNK